MNSNSNIIFQQRNPSEREDGNPSAPRRNLENLLPEVARTSYNNDKEEQQPGAAYHGAGEDQQHLVDPQGGEGVQVQGGKGVGGARLDQDCNFSRQCPELCEDHLGGGSCEACTGGQLQEDGRDEEEGGGDGEEGELDGQEGGGAGEEDAQHGGCFRPPSSEVLEGEAVHHFNQGEQRHQDREAVGGGRHLCGKACGGPDGQETGRQDEQGGHQILPPHQDWAHRPALGLQGRLCVRPGCHCHQDRAGATGQGHLHQLCSDQPTGLTPLRGAAAGEEQEPGQVLCGQRRLYLCPSKGERRQLGCHQGEADFFEGRSRLGRGRRSTPQPQPLDCNSKRGEGSLCQLEDTKKMLTAIVIPTIVPEAWYYVSSLSSEFGKMSHSCTPFSSKNPKFNQNIKKQVPFQSFFSRDGGNLGQAEGLGRSKGAKDND